MAAYVQGADGSRTDSDWFRSSGSFILAEACRLCSIRLISFYLFYLFIDHHLTVNCFRVFPEADRADGDAGAGGGRLQGLQGLLQPGAEGRGQRLHRESRPAARGGGRVPGRGLTVPLSPSGGPHHHHVPGGTGRGVC